MAASVLTECFVCRSSTLQGRAVCGRSSLIAAVDDQEGRQWENRQELRPPGVEAALALVDMGSFIARAAHMVQKVWNGGGELALLER
ncbi:unnamed protein product [Ixodes hexagonus]